MLPRDMTFAATSHNSTDKAWSLAIQQLFKHERPFRRTEVVEAGRERKRGGWLPSFLGLSSMPGGIPARLGKHPRPGAWRALGD